MFNLKKWVTSPITLVLTIAVFSGYGSIFSLSPASNGEDIALSPPLTPSMDFLQTIGYVANRSIQQINGWNARFGEQLAIFLLSVDPLVFSFVACVTLVFVSFLISRMYDRRPLSPLYIFLGVIGIFSCLPNFELLTWRTVNAGYLQPLVLYLIFFIAYLPGNLNKLKVSRKLLTLLSIVGFFAGLSFENGPVILVCSSIASMFFFHDLKIFRSAAVIPLLALVSGWILLLSAPSTQFRIKFYPKAFGTDNVPWVHRTIQRIPEVWDAFWSESWILLICWLLSCVALYFMRRETWKISVIAAVGITATWISIIPAPYTESRSFTFAWLLMISGVISFVILLWQRFQISIVLVALLATLGIQNMNTLYMQNQYFGQQLEARNFHIQDQSKTEKCQSGITIQIIKLPERNRFLNNRDIWVFDSLDQVSSHYGCLIKVEK